MIKIFLEPDKFSHKAGVTKHATNTLARKSHLVARCLETIDVCIWRMFVFMSVVVAVWGSVGMFVVQRPLLKIVFF